MSAMKTLPAVVAAAALSLPAIADGTPIVDKASAKLASGLEAAKPGARKLERGTRKALESGKEGGRKAAQKLKEAANDAAASVRAKR